MRPVPVFPDDLVKLVVPASRAILKQAVIYRCVSLPQMFMFLTDTTKTDFFHILVRTHLLVRSIHVCSWSSLTRYIENAAARSWSWSKRGDRGGVVFWCKICWHVFMRGHLWENFVSKSHPFREIPVWWKGRGQPRRRYYEHASTIFLVQTI